MNQSERLISTLHQSGMRLTPQRQAICDYLAASEDHPTAAMIYDALKPGMPSLSLMTVYNTLNTLSDLGAIQVLGQAGDDTVHYDPDMEPHVNLVCVSCHSIIDLPSKHLGVLRQEVNAGSGYRLVGEQVLFYGLCPDCQKKPDRDLE
jgi:Fur family peroxide stress response transcriptional regulator